MSSPENPIIENDPVMLKSNDEFLNERTERLIKFFHAEIKEQLKDPSKQFILLVNSDISYKKYRSVWSNNSDQKDKLFAELTEKEDQQNPVITPEEQKDIPKLVPIYTAESNDYYTDPETGLQHFPESIFNYDNNNYWLSKIEDNKELKIIFDKGERIKYIVIDFLDAVNQKYSFEIGFNTTEKDNNGKPIYQYIADTQDPQKRLIINAEQKDELQFIEFDNPLFTTELILNFVSETAGVNYLFVIENDLSKEAIKAFLEININT